MMSIKTTKMILKGVGVALAVCSAVSMAESCSLGMNNKSTKKMIKKAVGKMDDIADMVMSYM